MTITYNQKLINHKKRSSKIRKKSNNSVEKASKTLTNQRSDSIIINRGTMSERKCISNLEKIDNKYSLEMIGKKAKHNIEMFRVVDTSKNVVVANISENGDLMLNNDYKRYHDLMIVIISFFTTNAKVENTYTY